MKISFSTLGCPGWTWDDMLATAKDLGFDGIEVRGIENELYVPKAKPFTADNMKDTKARLNKLSLEIPCITSSCYLFDRSNIDFYLKEGKDYIDVASKLGTPYVRVLGDKDPDEDKPVDIGYVAENLVILAEHAQGKNVTLLLETNGVFADSDRMLKLIEGINNPCVAVLWDIHHPYRFKAEAVVDTYNKLKANIKHVHIKDSVMQEGRVKYKMLGYGSVPVKEALLTLKDDGYTGFVSLEWVKRWCIDLEEPGVVFSHFANYVRDVTK